MSKTTKALEDNRLCLLNSLQDAEKVYIRENWQPKEQRVIRCFTTTYPNLGCLSTQRIEGLHDTIRERTNGQLTLQSAVQKVCEKLRSMIKDLRNSDNSSLVSIPRLVQSATFKNLHFTISNPALTLLFKEWEELRQLMAENAVLGTCFNRCPILLQYGVACKHWL